jgi:kynurenine formamidase
MDAPGHFIADGRRTPEIDPAELVVPLVVVDIRRKVAQNPDALLSLSDVQAWEKKHGRIPKGSCVAMYSGWEQFVGDQGLYRGTDNQGVYHFPGFGLEAVDFLLEERSIHGIAVDTLSLDNGPSATFEVHLRLLGADRWGLENVANLGQVPPRGATIIAGVLPWEEGSGGPGRVLALVR